MILAAGWMTWCSCVRRIPAAGWMPWWTYCAGLMMAGSIPSSESESVVEHVEVEVNIFVKT